MRARWGRRGLVGAVVLGLTIVALFFNHPAPPPVFRDRAGVERPGYSPRGALVKPSSSDVEQVEASLDTRARAILSGDESAFMSVVDTDQRRFARRQSIVWENTRRLTLSRLSYRVDGVVEPDRPLSRPVFLARVTTTYQIRGYDSSPVEVDDGFSFVRRGGTWRLASTSDADHQFDEAMLPVPWEGAAIDTYGDGRYLVVVDRGRQAAARRVLALCQQGSRASADLLGITNHRPTVVLATSHGTPMRRVAGPDAAAVTYPLRGPDGVTPGWRVFVNPEEVNEVVASPITIPHELTHLATQDYLADVPSWLSEGAAEYVAWHGHGGLAAQLTARGMVGRLALPDQLPVSRTFYRQGVQLDYAEGTALVSWIEEHEGRGAVVALMRAYDDAGGYDVDFDPDRATPAILRDSLGLTPEALAHAAYAELNAAAS